jgi:hypothetical protein
VPYRYQDRAEQARAIAKARRWLERLEQLTQFETVVLRAAPRSPEAGRLTGDAAEGPAPRPEEE